MKTFKVFKVLAGVFAGLTSACLLVLTMSFYEETVVILKANPYVRKVYDFFAFECLTQAQAFIVAITVMCFVATLVYMLIAFGASKKALRKLKAHKASNKNTVVVTTSPKLAKELKREAVRAEKKAAEEAEKNKEIEDEEMKKLKLAKKKEKEVKKVEEAAPATETPVAAPADDKTKKIDDLLKSI